MYSPEKVLCRRCTNSPEEVLCKRLMANALQEVCVNMYQKVTCVSVFHPKTMSYETRQATWESGREIKFKPRSKTLFFWGVGAIV